MNLEVLLVLIVELTVTRTLLLGENRHVWSEKSALSGWGYARRSPAVGDPLKILT